MNINFSEKFAELTTNINNMQKKIDIDIPIKTYYGISPDGKKRLSFLTKKEPPHIDSTQIIQVIQGEENENVYWTCFDLLNNQYDKLFYILCDNLVNYISNCTNENDAIIALKNRYYSWKTMFKRVANGLSDEREQGLFGEIYFLKTYMIPKYGIEKAINAWAGPDNYSKDYSLDTSWYEIKTIGQNTNSVKISSIGQLSSNMDGYLVVIKVEKMSNEFNEKNSSIIEIFRDIMKMVQENDLQELLVKKIVDYGFNPIDDCLSYNFDVKDTSLYKVSYDFPRIREDDIKYQEIDNVRYEIILSTISKFKAGEE